MRIQKANFLLNEEFRAVRGLILELERRVGYARSGIAKKLDDFFSVNCRHADLVKQGSARGFLSGGEHELYNHDNESTGILSTEALGRAQHTDSLA